MPTRYELMYIIPAKLTDAEVGAVEAKVSALLTKLGAAIESAKRLGKFRFTYPIEHQRHGHYVLTMIQADPSAVAKIEENLRMTEDVLRHLIIQTDQAEVDQKYQLVQFTEVNVEQREDRPRRHERPEAAREPAKAKDTIKSGVAVLEAMPATEIPVASDKLSTEELDKKIETALNEDIKDL